MGKILKDINDKNIVYERISRWIAIRTDYNPNPSEKNCLRDYVTDGDGYSIHSDKFDNAKGLYLDFFEYENRKYAVDQFLKYDSIVGYVEKNKNHYLFGYDGDNYHKPYLIEVDQLGEKIRLYEKRRL